MSIPHSSILKKIGGQKGAIGAISASAMGLTLAMMSFCVDAGYIFSVQTELQNAADSAALAAITKLPVTADEGRALSVGFANEFKAGGKNVVLNPENVELGKYDFVANEFRPNELPINASFVRAKRSSEVSSGNLALFFANMFGIQDVSVAKTSLAAVDPRVVGVMANNHLIPYSCHIDICDANSDGQFDIGSEINMYLRNGADKGNFGFLDLDGGPGGTPELRQFIRYGYDLDLTIPPAGFIYIDGDTGIRGNSLTEAFEEVYYDFETQTGPILYLPVHEDWWGRGAGATFKVVGFVAVKLKQVHLTGSSHSRFIKADIVESISSNFIVRNGAPTNNSLSKVRLVE